MATAPLPGYVGLAWTAMKSAMSYANANMDTANPQASVSLVEAVAQTLRNGVAAIGAYQFMTGVQAQYNLLATILALPLSLDPTTAAYVTNRVSAMQTVSTAAASMLVPIQTSTTLIAQGAPMIPDPGVIEWMMNYAYETVPTGLTANSFVADAQQDQASWATLINALETQGVTYNGSAFDAVQSMYLASQVTANEVAALSINSAADVNAAWNRLMGLPCVSRTASMSSNDPTNAAAQQIAALRYVSLSALRQFQTLLVTYETAAPSKVQTATLRVGETLMDLAARTMGDYSQWYAIAQVNALLPPFIGSVPAPNIAVPGQTLFLPTAGTVVPSGGQAPTYNVNFLGVDKYLGPMNQDMLPWQGDFQLISGFPNLTLSLGRRLQTTLGSLIYHPNFGSRIPPEIGAVESQQTSGYIGAYAKSAILSDPRVASVPKVVVETNNSVGQVVVAATVVPQGMQGGGVNVNEVLQPIA